MKAQIKSHICTKQNCMKLFTVTLNNYLRMHWLSVAYWSLVFIDVLEKTNKTVSSKWLDNLMNYVLTVELKDKLWTCRQAFWVSIPFSSKNNSSIIFLIEKERCVLCWSIFFREHVASPKFNTQSEIIGFNWFEYQSRKSVTEIKNKILQSKSDISDAHSILIPQSSQKINHSRSFTNILP